MTDEFHRASGEMSCKVCGEPYRNHPYSDDIGFDGPFLKLLCDGRKVKL